MKFFLHADLPLDQSLWEIFNWFWEFANPYLLQVTTRGTLDGLAMSPTSSQWDVLTYTFQDNSFAIAVDDISIAYTQQAVVWGHNVKTQIKWFLSWEYDFCEEKVSHRQWFQRKRKYDIIDA